MAEPTLKDVLDAVAKIDAKVTRLEKGQAALDAKIDRVDVKVDAVRADVAAHRKETAKGFEDLDKELAKHADPLHRKLEARIERLEKRTAPKKVAARPLRRR